MFGLIKVGYTGSSPSASIKIDGPKTVIAVWRTDHTILLIALVLPLVAGASGTAVYFARRKSPTLYSVPPSRVKKETRKAIVEPHIPELQALEKMLRDGTISFDVYERIKKELEKEKTDSQT
ncbi:MAG: hypothetical protein QXJ73_08275 [Candidatus Caldarchaeum sp.]